jgi:hypothetical protein
MPDTKTVGSCYFDFYRAIEWEIHNNDLSNRLIDETWNNLCNRDPSIKEEYGDEAWYGDVELDGPTIVVTIRVYQ